MLHDRRRNQMLAGVPCQPSRKITVHSLCLQSASVVVSCSEVRVRLSEVTFDRCFRVGSIFFRYEAAGTLVTLSAAPAAIKAAASAYIDLIVKESDNNVKV